MTPLSSTPAAASRPTATSRPINADHLDGVRDGNTSSMFYRDASRGQHGSEHTLFFHGANVEALVDRYKFRTEHESSYKTGLNFADNAVDQCTGAARPRTCGDV